MPMFRNTWFAAVMAAAFMTPAPLLATVPATATPAAAAARAPEILMYVLPDCGYCIRARNYLRSRGLTWNEIDISTSEENREAFAAAGGRGTPLIMIDEARVHGFDEEGLERALAAYAPTPKGAR